MRSKSPLLSSESLRRAARVSREASRGGPPECPSHPPRQAQQPQRQPSLRIPTAALGSDLRRRRAASSNRSSRLEATARCAPTSQRSAKSRYGVPQLARVVLGNAGAARNAPEFRKLKRVVADGVKDLPQDSVFVGQFKTGLLS